MNSEKTTQNKKSTTLSNGKEYIIDAKGKRLGRVATEAASVLLGKNTTHFAKNIVEPITVKITNASLLDISEKRGTEEFQRYSGYPGGRNVETLSHLGKRRGYGEVVRRVVNGMLPKNKLQKLRMHNLEVTE
jgi:large subunit ribosomal protein L13